MEDSDKKRLAVTAEHVPLLGDHREDDKVSTGRDYRGESGRRRLSMVLAVSALMLFLLLARWLIPETALDVIDPFVWFTNVPDSADVVNEEETVVSGNRHHRGKPLIVYIIPHSHDDVGWIKTPDEYYNDQVKHIYKNVIREMSVKPNRTFIVVEQAYFSRWFDNDANNHEREFVRQFLADGRLEFVLGAWAMPDEACTTADAVVEDLAAGHRYIREKFGIQPRYGFQIDPFGHSAAIPALYAQMGFHAVVLNRIHWLEKNRRKEAGTMEFVWSGGATGHVHANQSSILAHVLDRHYSSPQGMDFERDPPIADEEDLTKRAESLVKELRDVSRGYPSRSVMMQLAGDDFKWLNASAQFTNWELVMDHVNKHSHHHGVFLRFGTLHDYFSALHSEDIRFTHEGARDFFPYADNIESFWTGYFSSKPVLKRAARAAERFLRASEMLLTRVALTTRNEETNGIPAWYTLLEDYRQATAQIQHHDGITGTSTEHVSQVYLDDLDNAWAKLSKTVEEEVLKLAPFKSIDDKMTIDAERSMLTKLGHGYGISMMMTNSLAFSVDTVHVIPVPTEDFVMLDGHKRRLPSQVFRNPLKLDSYNSNSPFLLAFHAVVPALGESLFLLGRLDGKVTDSHSSHLPVQVTNEHVMMRMTRSEDGGVQLSLQVLATNEVYVVQTELMVYESYAGPGQASGAYIFRTAAPAVRIPYDLGEGVEFLDGPLVQEIRLRHAGGAIQIFRIRSTASVQDLKDIPQVEIITKLPPLKPDREVVVRFTAPAYRKHFDLRTDANALYMTERRDRLDMGYASHFYPSTSMVSVANGRHQITCLTDVSIAVGSNNDGEWEFMLQRRTSKDDGRGVEEALNDQTSVTSTITMLFSKKDIAEKLRPSMELAKRFAPLTFYGLTTRAIIGGVQPPPVPSLAEQKCELPPSWHLQSLQTITSLTGGTTSHTLLRLRKITSDMPHEISAADVWKCLGELWEDVPAATIIERMGLSGVTPASELEDTRMRWKFEQSSHHYHHKHHHHHAVANPTENASFDQLGVVFTFKIEYN